MLEHTPTPWEVDEDLFIHHEGTILLEMLYKNLMPHYKEQSEIDAKFIITAVNSHADLIEALKSSLTALTHIGEHYGYDIVDAEIAQIIQALQKAGVK